MTTILIVGGTSGIGREIARQHAARGADVIITGRDASRAATAAKEIGGARGLALDLTRPGEIASALADVEHVDHVVLAAIERDQNTAADYRLDGAQRLATLKLVGYTEVVHALLPRMSRDGSIVIFGGLAKDRPYPGSTMVSAVNGAVTGLVRTLAVELAPIRVNAVHPGIVGDSPFWRDKPLDAIVSRTPTGRLATMDDVADAVAFLLRNPSVNGVNLDIDGGWLLT
ncbi:SDR family oxidoreductase [Actinomadura miaoliensis]|uniref:SDR family oxidoreductase n=1 Tax=Actinomadura miaoliensis TaxID=430685 RepID=A0ABP7X7Y6_9ACTN